MLTTRQRHAVLAEASACRRALTERQQRRAVWSGANPVSAASSATSRRLGNTRSVSWRRASDSYAHASPFGIFKAGDDRCKKPRNTRHTISRGAPVRRVSSLIARLLDFVESPRCASRDNASQREHHARRVASDETLCVERGIRIFPVDTQLR